MMRAAGTYRRALVAAAIATLVSAGPAAIDAEAGFLPARFEPVADAHVSKAKRNANFGRSKRLVADGSPTVRSYLRFNVRGLGGSVTYATLELSVMNSSTRSFIVRRAGANHWSENRIRFKNAPRPGGPGVRARRVKSFRMASIDVTRLVPRSGVVTLVVIARGRGGVTFASGEAPKALRPQLVVGVNNAPACANVSLFTSEDTAETTKPICVDLEKDRLAYKIVSQGTQGTASIVNGELRYAPRANTFGSDKFVYRAKDRRKWSKPATVTVSIRPVNDAPACEARTLVVDEDGGGAVGHLCSDVDGDHVNVSITSTAQNGKSWVVGGELRYEPNPNTNGADIFSYRARDTTLPSAPATVTVIVRPVNDPPVCGPVSLTTTEDIPVEYNPSCSDIDGDGLTYGIAAQGGKGTASGSIARLHYAPAANANGDDAFTYFAYDGAAASAPASASVAIAAVNDAPFCEPVPLETPEDTPREINPNCWDAEGDAMSVSIVSQGTKGTASISAGKLRYVPKIDVIGPDTFTYRAQDVTGPGAAATVSVNIGAVNDRPACTATTVATTEDVAGTAAPRCSDLDGDTLTYEIGAQGAKGTASVVGGQLRYLPNANANGTDSFTYLANDGGLTSAPATVSVTIDAVNDAPVCANVTLATNEDVTGERDPSCSDADGDPLTYATASQGAKGAASLVSGKLRYVPNANANGPDSFTYQARDGALSSAAAIVAVTIAPVNDAPACGNVSLATNEDVTGERDPSCADIDGDLLTYSIVDQGTRGVATVASGKLRYVPTANANGLDSFTYRASDGAALSGAATVATEIRAVNDAPACENFALATDEDVMAERAPSCSDVDGDTLTYTTTSQGTKGVASVVSGKLRYVPKANANGSDSFTYQARDGAGASSAQATVSVSIAAVNDTPTCAGVELATDEDAAAERDPSCSDIDGDALTYSIGTQGAKGGASVVSGKLRYVPAANVNGSDTFTYRASDGALTSAAATVTVTIAPLNDVPTCANISLATDEDVLGERDPSCSDPDDDALTLTYAIVSQGTKGTASVVSGKLRYVPAANVNGSDTFTYRASDTNSQSAAATVTVTIRPVNDAPVCGPVTLTTTEETAVEGNPSCSDVEDDALTYWVVAGPAKGTASISSGRLRYVPNVNAAGSDSFTYRASDAGAQSAAATVSVSISGINDAPTCQPVSLTTNEDTTGERDPSCSDPDGDALTHAIVSQGTKGTASVVGGKLRYAPKANANGADTFTYRASDGALSSASATVTVSIAAVNDTPVCENFSVPTNEDELKEFDPPCTDIDGDTLSYLIVGQGTKGTASGGARLRYTPDPNANGTDSFTYRATDGGAQSAVATTSVTIAPVNDAPVCSKVSMTIDEDGSDTQPPNCTDPEGNSLAYSIASQGTKGTASINAGNLHYVANQNATGSDSFTYRASDGTLSSAPSPVAVSIGAVNDAPVCSARTLTIDEDNVGTVTPLCSDPEGDPMTYSISAQGTKGTASVVAGELRYVPNPNANGTDTFWYRAHDPALAGEPAMVSVTIRPVNDAPACSNVTLTTNEDTPGERDPSCTDIDGDAPTISIASQGTKGTASVVAGKLRYVPNANVNGADSFTYRANDGLVPSAPATVSVTIAAANDAPVCDPVRLDTTEDTPAEVNPNCTDIDGDALSYSIVSQGTKGTASVAAGKLRYVPNSNLNGSDSFTYRANDAATSSAAATVTVSIAPANDAPTCVNRTLALDEDTTSSVAPLCTDPEGDPVSFEIVSQGTKGVASVASSELRYAANSNVNGTDSFTYRGTDGALTGAPATVSVTIRPTNDAPTCANVALATNEDTTGEHDPSCSDIDGDPLTYSIASQGTKGTASVNAGKLRFAPSANVNGSDSFTYQASDGTLVSGTATVTVTIAPGNDAPTCANVSLATDEDVIGERDPACSDIDGDPLTYSIATQGAKGTASVAGGRLRYLSNANANGSDTFTYRASDGSAASASASVAVTIRAINDAPTCSNVALPTNEDTTGERDPSCADVDGDSLTFSIASPATKGTASISAAKLRYAPNANVHGTDSFTYQASDGALASGTATVAVTIASVNDAPTCANLSLATDEDVPAERDPSCSDVDGDALSYSIASQGTKGTASIASGKLRYAPSANANGPDSFTYGASDGTLVSAPAGVAVTIRPVNDAPACSNVSLTTLEDTPGERDPSCTDPEGDPLVYSIVTQGTKGTASVVDGKLRYVPEASATGSDAFSYRASDGVLVSAPATVAVTIVETNDAPVCFDVALATDEDVIGERDPSCSDVDGDTLTYEIVSQGAKGSASVAGGKLHYVPNPNAVGADSFTYRASDSRAASASATVSVTIRAVNDAPVCANVALATDEDVAAERDPSCSDVDGDTLTYSIASQGAKGTASVVGAKLRYGPNSNANGSDSFGYRASDGAAWSSPATVAVTIKPVNDAPVCLDVSLTTDEDTAGERDPSCTDVDGDPLVYSILSQGTNGAASVVGGKLRYAPNANATGGDTFAYRADDSRAISGSATVSVTIRPVNDAPICSNVALTTDEDVSAESNPSCTDVDGDSLTYSIVSQGSKGTASVVSGKLRYAPNANANGSDSFTYQAGDGNLASPAATVSVTIRAVNDAPVCRALSLSTSEETPAETDPDCTDAEGDPLTYSIVSQGSKGTASVTTTKRLRYSPHANTNGSDSFTYRASDPALQGAPATVSVTITTANDPPVCLGLALTTDEDVAAEGNPSCTDIDGDPLTYAIATQGSKGTASVVSGRLRYVPSPNANGVDSFTYTASDGIASSAPATVSVTITPRNDAPTCADITLTTDEEVPGLRDPDCTDVDGDSLTYSIVSQGSKGTASIVSGKLRYAPDVNATGADSFTYRARDSFTSGAPATVSVTIRPVNDAPACADLSVQTSEDVPVERDPSCSDVDGDPLTYSIASQGTKGTASVVAGKLRYEPNPNVSGEDSFSYRANDGVGDSNVATVSVTITPANDAPAANGFTLTTSEETAKTFSLAANDADGDSLEYTIVSEPTHGVLSGAGSERTYTPNANYHGSDSFTFRASDGKADSNVAAVTVTVTSVNDAPVAADVSVSTPEDAPAAVTLDASDVDGDSLGFTIVSGPTHGLLSGSGANRTYTPNANYNGADSFTYKASDGTVDSNVATVTLTVAAVNDAPVCPARTLTVEEDSEGSIAPVCTDPEGDPVSLQIGTQALKGSASVVANALRYVANANATGADSFTYRASDGAIAGAPATVSVTIASVNDAPACSSVSLTTSEDVTGERDPSCTDVDGDTLTYSIVSQGTKGSASVVGAKLRYTPNANANGTDSFTYRAADAAVASAPATVSVAITAVNDAPVCPAQTLTIDEDTNGSVTPVCTDPEGNSITIEIVDQPVNGTASVAGGALHFVPFADMNGSDSFTYRGKDGALGGAPATVSVTVRPLNDEPEAVPVDVATGKGVAKVITLDGFDADGDSLTFRIVSLPANGGLRAGPNASDHLITSGELPYSLTGTQVRYEPNVGFTGTNTFEFRAHDGTTTGLPADVRVSVVGANTAPVCATKTVAVDEDATLTDSACSDPEGDSLTFTRTGPTNGQLTLFEDGSFEYVPDENYNGQDSFSVVATDPSGLSSASGTVTITVAAVNDAPTCRAFTVATTEDTVGRRFADCEDVENSPLVYTIVEQGTKGTASVEADSRLRYVPNADENGADSFTFTVSDGALTSGPHTAAVSIAAVNDAPVCRAVALTTRVNTPGATFSDCEDVEGDPLTYTIVDQPAHGAASVAGQELRYDPDFAYIGEDSFTYRASDGTLSSPAANVSVTVTL